MRTKSGDKEKLRLEILKDSVQSFKKFGHAGAPVDQIMKKSGLTSGALYSHFKGKDDLFLQAAQLDLDSLVEYYRDRIAQEGPQALKGIVDSYLSVEHVEAPEEGCLYTALSADVFRAKGKKKANFDQRFEKLVEVIAQAVGGGTLAERKKKAALAFMTMTGALSVARMLHPHAAMNEVLALGRQQAHEILGR